MSIAPHDRPVCNGPRRLLPEPLAVQLDDAEWAELYGECGSCCRPVDDCCSGCQGRYCQVCRDRF